MVTGAQTAAWVSRFRDRVHDGVDQLTALDRATGDGDFGQNLDDALSRAVPVVDALTDPTPGEVFAALTDAFLDTGGTSGPLFGLWFGHLAKAAGPRLSAAELAAAVQAGTAAVQRLGGAEVGHKTMVDALVPATDALQASNDASVSTALSAAARAAQVGTDATADLVAARGRASYVGERAIGVVDPGALAVAWFFGAAEGAA